MDTTQAKQTNTVVADMKEMKVAVGEEYMKEMKVAVEKEMEVVVEKEMKVAVGEEYMKEMKVAVEKEMKVVVEKEMKVAVEKALARKNAEYIQLLFFERDDDVNYWSEESESEDDDDVNYVSSSSNDMFKFAMLAGGATIIYTIVDNWLNNAIRCQHNASRCQHKLKK